MAGLKVIFASIASIGIAAAAAVSAVLVAPQLMEDDVAAAASSMEPAFVGMAPVAFDDPAGDASDLAWGDVGTFADCLAGGVVSGACAKTVPAVAAPRGAAHLDIVSVAMSEPGADEVVLTLGIAELDEGLDALASPAGMHRMTTYGVCLYDEDGCTRAAYLKAMRHGDAAHLEASFESYAEECNAWSWCSWTLPVQVTYGSPAQIVFRVPKAWVGFGGDLAVHHLDAWTAWDDQPTVFPMWHGGATLHTPARHLHTHTPTPGSFGVGDMTPELPVDITLAAPAHAPAHALDAPLASGGAGASHAHGSEYDRAELDLAGFDIYDEDGGIAVVIALAEASAHPEYDFDYAAAIGFAGQPVMEVGYRQEAGEPMGYAGVCIMEECQESRTLEIEAELVTGAPAFVVLHLPADVLAELIDVAEGDEVTLVWLSTMVTDGSQYFGDYEGDAYGDVHHAFMADEIVGGAHFVLGSGHRAPLESFGAPAEHAH